MVSLCMCCNVVTGINLKALPGLSHGICPDCMPGYLRHAGMTEEEIKDFMEKYKKEEK